MGDAPRFDGGVDNLNSDGSEPLPAIDPVYLAEATEFGLSEDQVRATPREVFQQIKDTADRRVFDRVNQVTSRLAGGQQFTPPPADQQPQFSGSPYQQPPQQPYANQVQRQPAQQPSPFAVKPYELPEDDGELDFDKKHLGGINKHYAGQLGEMQKYHEAQLAERDGAIAYLANQQNNNTVDRFIDKLGPEWAGEFGDGLTQEYEPGSREFIKRAELWTAAKTAQQIHWATTGKMMPVSKALPQALGNLYRDKVSAQERVKAEAAARKLTEGASDRPRASAGAPPVSGLRGRAMSFVNRA